ncbi:hypothetical protein BpHYR1_038003 [Brachionus plicatilis]|uniref:Uncharacterized protein n=1 Tax=Brachionus plicatilis TaxID=10195 RepID=A0A3M7R0I8_BRAPC|nr:hypothetical protein BpHYR1_038003 [Brachionus plicatilis]
MNNQEKTKSSVFLNPDDQTLVDAEELPYQHILKEPSTKRKRSKNTLFELHSTFEDLAEIKKKINDGEIKGHFWELKSHKNGKHQTLFMRIIKK